MNIIMQAKTNNAGNPKNTNSTTDIAAQNIIAMILTNNSV